ncbi:hypothetical protein [Parvibium lacunae]|uniref:hypothetical protein n=1 Tax=Parvibium lacunae TaxID=1888893 RepID=UPI001EFEB406|nr:hypothetical protein [Parvibium lacunae]
MKARSAAMISPKASASRRFLLRKANLTTLAPDIVAAILYDALPNHITLFEQAVDPPALWDEQRSRLTVRD